MSATTKPKKKKSNPTLWIVVGLFAAAAFLAFFASKWYGPLKPVIPGISLASEEIWPGAMLVPAFDIGGFRFEGVVFSNTVLCILLTDLALLAIAVFIVRPYLRGNNPVPSKPYSVLEMLLEYFWEMVKNAVGSKWVGRVFPVVMTIFLLILTANWIKLLPGFETVGWFREASAAEAEKAHPVLPFIGGLYALDGTTDEGTKYELVPFLRGSSTDLNFPASMAVVTVGGIFLFGAWSQKTGFIQKYLPTRRLRKSPAFGAIDLLVGILEFFLEFVKIISLTLRLFGNIFAGGLLLLIVGSLTVIAFPTVLVAFELFIGTIQAYVFALLAAIFIQMAMAGHEDEPAHGC